MFFEKQIYKFPETSSLYLTWFCLLWISSKVIGVWETFQVEHLWKWWFDGMDNRRFWVIFWGKILKEAGSKQDILGDVSHIQDSEMFHGLSILCSQFFWKWNWCSKLHDWAEKLPWQVVGDIEKDGIKAQILFENSAKRKQKNPQLLPSGKLT